MATSLVHFLICSRKETSPFETQPYRVKTAPRQGQEELYTQTQCPVQFPGLVVVASLFFSDLVTNKKQVAKFVTLISAILSCPLSTETARQDIPVHLVVAGGYDPNCRENVEHFRELQTLAQVLQLDDHVSFLRSPSENVKQLLLHSCRAIVYTPSEEHFGIVPLEAMYMRKPVVACNSGGPTETVSDGETGFLCEPTPESFGAAMVRLARDRSLAQEMGISGRERVVALFSWERFVRELVRAVL